MKINLPIKYLDIESLAQRWHCNLATIESLAETKNLKFYLRPVIFEIALNGAPPESYNTTLKKLTNSPIDSKYIYMMFKNLGHQIEINRIGPYDAQEILPNPLCADFFDLIIPIEQIEDFEFICGDQERQEQFEFKLLSEDFSCFIWCGQEYRFGEIQAKVIKRLWQAREELCPWMYGKRILADIGSASYRLKSVFNHNKYWRRIIMSDGHGKYRLKIPLRYLKPIKLI